MDKTLQLFDALSPLDGRYRSSVEDVAAICSEAGLIRQRLHVEIAWLLFLADHKDLKNKVPLTPACRQFLMQLQQQTGPEAIQAIKTIERITQHDVKAVEYFLRDGLQKCGATDATLAHIHFGLTSEDVNNVSYALMLRDMRAKVLLPLGNQLLRKLQSLARMYAKQPMLARTHGQAATPTTLGKEFAVFGDRLWRQLEQLRKAPLLAKWSGAVGHWNALYVAEPQINWRAVSRQFLQTLELEANEYTTQIEPHDYVAEWLGIYERALTISLDLARDAWGYVSLGYLRQEKVAHEVGSSTMPHKVNPIDFENAEGNMGLAISMAQHLSAKLPVSRWQRDLSDSTVLRSMGMVFGYGVVAWKSLLRGLNKVAAHPPAMAKDLDGCWEVLTEAVQTTWRHHGIADAYEKFKALSRGQEFSQQLLHTAINNELAVNAADRERLLALQPAQYLGLAAELAMNFADRPLKDEV